MAQLRQNLPASLTAIYLNTHNDFIKYNAPLPLEIAKQNDLRVLSTFLARYMAQDEIDELYPEPDRHVDNSDGDDNTSDDDSE